MAAPPFSGIIMLDLPSVAKSSPAAAACNEDGVPGRSTVDCARDGRLTMLAKRTRAGANGGSAFCKEPGEETPTFLGTVRRMTLGPRRDGGERPEQYMIMQLELAPAQPGTA
jgi:hypothetical protein